MTGPSLLGQMVQKDASNLHSRLAGIGEGETLAKPWYVCGQCDFIVFSLVVSPLFVLWQRELS